jgi:hypothetical protein
VPSGMVGGRLAALLGASRRDHLHVHSVGVNATVLYGDGLSLGSGLSVLADSMMAVVKAEAAPS